MKTRALTSADVAEVVLAVGIDRFYDELIESMTEAVTGYDPALTIARTRDGFHYHEPDLGLLEWMPTMQLGSLACVKTVGYHPTNPGKRGLPSVMSTTALYDTASGELVALAESTLLTALRTGVASAIASDILAADRPLVVGVIGCGAQAVTQLHALSPVRRIDEILAFDVDPSVSATLERRLGLPLPVSVIDDGRRRTLPCSIRRAGLSRTRWCSSSCSDMPAASTWDVRSSCRPSRRTLTTPTRPSDTDRARTVAQSRSGPVGGPKVVGASSRRR